MTEQIFTIDGISFTLGIIYTMGMCLMILTGDWISQKTAQIRNEKRKKENE